MWLLCRYQDITEHESTTHINTGVVTMTVAEDVSQRVRKELVHHGVNHTTVALWPAHDDRSMRLNDYSH